MEKAYVFVVCGAKEHIDTLHFSLKSFKKNTSYPKIVITDTNRNEIPIIHDNIIHVDTPKEMDHHQASIFLKTSIYKYLPKGGRYVYMDSDILAIGNNCDSIFEQYIPPIRFGADHCNLPLFSPTALNCNCKEENAALVREINKYASEQDPFEKSKNPEIQKQREALNKKFQELTDDKVKSLIFKFKSYFFWPYFSLGDFKFNRRDGLWYDGSNNPIMLSVNWPKVAKKFNLKFNHFSNQVTNSKGESIWVCQCEHLIEAVQKEFDVQIKNKEWQHWNGGVFLFDDQSHDFLDYWHNATMQIFKNPYWKTRDQGTLIATAWKFNLQNQPLLDIKWNRICDFNNPSLDYRVTDNAIIENGKVYKNTEFAHVYHHFGDKNWEFWNWISKGFVED